LGDADEPFGADKQSMGWGCPPIRIATEKAIHPKGPDVTAILAGIQTYHEFMLIGNEPHALRRSTERRVRSRTQKI